MVPQPLRPADYPERIGPHLLRVEGDTLYMKFIGYLMSDEAHQMLTRCDEVCVKYGWVFMVSDMTDALPAPLEARKVIANWTLLGRYAMAAHGISTPVRVIMQLMQAARKMMGRPGLEAYAAPDETAARQWVAELRRTLQAAKRG